MRVAARDAARPILQSARAKAPKKKGKLRRGIKLRAAKRSRVFVGVRILTPTRKELGIPDSSKGYYPASMEYGFTHRSGKDVEERPYMRPAFDENLARSKARLIRVARQEIRRQVLAG